MKVAILTQPLGKNYGGIIQAWALQQVLKDAGHHPVTIDRQLDIKGPAYRAARLGYSVLQKALGRKKGPISFESHLSTILQHTRAFVERNINVSEPLHSTAGLKAHFVKESYGAVVVGSDQTWRPRYSPNINNFFLDFIDDDDVRRIAYASSFGVDEWEFSRKQTQLCAALAGKFDLITVREDSGVKLCEEYLKVQASHVLDPTFLIERQRYQALYEGENIPSRSGIFTYILDKEDWKDKVVNAAVKKLKEETFVNQPKSSMYQPDSKSLDDYVLPCVEGWLKSFVDAQFVITDSFHGTVFSIIFNKPFISLINPSRGASRFYSMTNDLGLSERVLSGFDSIAVADLLESPIDYGLVNRKLDLLASKSKGVLLGALS